MSSKNNGIGLFGELIDTIKTAFAKPAEKMQNNSGDTEVDFVLIQDDGEPVPEITVEEIEEAQKDIDDEADTASSENSPSL